MSNARHSRKIKTEVIIAPQEQNEAETVPVRLLRHMIVYITGRISGKEYIFNNVGSVVNVDKEDVEGMMKRNVVKQSCCGSYSNSPYFEILV